MIVTNYSDARAHLASYMDKATDDREEVRITRRGRPDIVLMLADELDSWRETIYLMRSLANAERLRDAFADAATGDNLIEMSVEDLKRDMGLGA